MKKSTALSSSEKTNAAAPPGLFALPPGAAFLEILAERLLADPSLGGALGDCRLQDITLLLPNRRAVSAMGELLLEKSGKRALLLPRLAALGDEMEELTLEAGQAGAGDLSDPAEAPAANVMERHLALAAMIRACKLDEQFAGQGWVGAVHLAQALTRSFDEAQRARADFSLLADMEEDGLAAHRQKNLALLQVLVDHWPAYLQRRGLEDPVARRNLLLDRYAATLACDGHPVVIAGSTGANAAVAALMGQAARRKAGMIIFPAFDFGLQQQDWDSLHPAHPYAGMKRALAQMGFTPAQVRLLPGVKMEGQGKIAFLRALFCPPDRAHLPHYKNKINPAAWDAQWLEAATPEEEAAMIACLLHDHIASGAKGDAVLATPDQKLGDLVSAQLARFGLQADAAAGRPLANAPVFVFMRLLAEAARDDFTPAAFLALAKHPYAAAGLARGRFRHHARRLERHTLRDSLPPRGLAAMAAQIEQTGPPDASALLDFLARIRAACNPLCAQMAKGKVALADLVRAHILAAEQLAARAENEGFDFLWPAQPEAANFFTALLEHAGQLSAPVAARDYPKLLEQLAAPYPVRARRRKGNRLHIWGLREARLLAPALLIVGGLNDNRLPAPAAEDPWLNQEMRLKVGLPTMEAGLGHQAHDFLQCQAARKLVLTHTAGDSGGGALLPSRWLLRARALGFEPQKEAVAQLRRRLAAAWPPGTAKPFTPPAISPPVALRPKKLSASALTDLVRNPYAFYAARILNLRPLPELDAPPGAALFGTQIHALLESYAEAWPYADPQAAAEKILQLGETMIAPYAPDPGTRLLWQRRLERAAENMARAEAILMHDKGVSLWAEEDGEMEMTVAGQRLILRAKADRLERLADGRVRLFDYKSGAVPDDKAIATGRAPQLPLVALLACAGAYAPLGRAKEVALLAHIDLKAKAGKKVLRPAASDAACLAQARAGIGKILAAYLAPGYSFLFRDGSVYGRDYAHLARAAEWGEAGNHHARR